MIFFVLFKNFGQYNFSTVIRGGHNIQ